jgi:type IV pilus assembly protein PilW
VNYSKAFESLSSDDLIVLAFKFVPDDDDLEEGSLQCKSLNAKTPQYNEMLKGVADMRLDFGIGSSSAIDKEITSFVSQSEWSASSGAIHGINYSLLLASGTNQRDSDDSQILSNWLAASTSATQERLTAADNKRIYQVASNTQILRNLMP